MLDKEDYFPIFITKQNINFTSKYIDELQFSLLFSPINLILFSICFIGFNNSEIVFDPLSKYNAWYSES